MAWIPSTRCSAPRGHPQAPARRCSPTPLLAFQPPSPLGLLAPFPMCPPLACSEYYGASAPPAAHSRPRTCPPPRPAARTGGRPQTVPTFTSYRSASSAPSCTPAASPRLRRRPSPRPPHRPTHPASELTAPVDGGHLLHTGPYPPDLSRHDPYGASTTGSLSLYLLALLAGPDPSGSPEPFRRCRGCFPPSPAFPGSGCPQLH